jgi:hypothetical protein
MSMQVLTHTHPFLVVKPILISGFIIMLIFTSGDEYRTLFKDSKY